MNQLATKPTLAAKIAAVVIQPRKLIVRPFSSLTAPHQLN
jgi:hypothetical protein